MRNGHCGDRDYWDEYPAEVYERQPLFGEELDRLEDLSGRAKELGLSEDDRSVLQEAAIAIRVLEKRTKEGIYNWHMIERVRGVAVSVQAAQAYPEIRKLLEIPKATDALRSTPRRSPRGEAEMVCPYRASSL